jgi:magnesium chelatase accessory protein
MAFPQSRLDWARDGADWPLRAHSRFVAASDLRWHVQVLGDSTPPRAVALLLHGVGGASHSWRAVAPLLAERFTVLVPDLPGHGFTDQGPYAARTLPGMAAALGALCAALDAPPALLVGHSAGAAVAARMALDGRAAPAAIVAFNGAFLPFRGVAGALFPSMARLLALNPLTPPLMAGAARGPAVARLLGAIGARRDPVGERLYARLFRNPGHVSAALHMMAAWELGGLLDAMGRLRPRLTLVAGLADRAVDPAEADQVAARVPGAQVLRWPGLGHLAHEDDPQAAAKVCLQAAAAAGITTAEEKAGRDST